MTEARKNLLRFILLGLYGILLTPLLFSPWFSSPFLTSKILPFQVLVELIVAAAALVQLADIFQRAKKPQLKDFLPSSPVIIGIGGFLGYSFISSFLGADFMRSLWGIEVRQDGLVLLAHFYVWLVVVSWYLNRAGAGPTHIGTKSSGTAANPPPPGEARRHYKRFLDFSYIVSILVAITVLFHWIDIRYKTFGVIPDYFNQYHALRGFGVFGNAEYVAPYLAFHLFYGVYAIWTMLQPVHAIPQMGVQKSSAAAGKILCLAGLILAQTALLGAIVVGQVRAMGLGLLIGLIFFGTRLVLSERASWKIKIASVCLSLLLISAGGLLWKYRDSPAFQRLPLLNRLHQSNIQSTLDTRTMLWKSALRGVQDRPLFGWGRSNAQLPLEKHYNPAMVQFDYRATDFFDFFVYDKSHNAFLDLLVEAGIIGCLIFAGLVFLIARSWWNIPELAASCCVGAGLVAYLTSNAVAFDSFGSLFALFLFLGWMESESEAKSTLMPEQPQTEPKHNKKTLRNSRSLKNSLFYPACAFLILSVIGILLYLNTVMAFAGYYRARALNAFTWNHPDLGLEFYGKAFGYFSPYNGREKGRAATLLTKAAFSSRQRPVPQDILDRILLFAGEAEKENSNDPTLLTQLGLVYYNLGLAVDRSYLRQAEACVSRALELSPTRQAIMMVLGNIYLVQSEPARAASIYKQAVDNYEAFPLAHWYYALALIDNNQQQAAKSHIKRSLELGFRFQDEKEAKLVQDLFGLQEYAELMKGR